MKRNIIIIVLLIVIFFLNPVKICSGSTGLNFYADGKSVKIRTIIRNGEIYVSLSDLGKLTDGEMLIDTIKNRVDINIKKPAQIAIPPGGAPPTGVVLGRILVRGASEIELPLKNAHVILYISNGEVPEEISFSTFSRMVAGMSNEYAQTHGRVREGKSDKNGRFYLTNIPPGEYEITAFLPDAGGKSRYFWRKKIKMGKSRGLNILFNLKNRHNIW